MALLLVLSGYLTFTWQRERIILAKEAPADDGTTPKKDTVKFWIFDQLHILCLVIVAIMAATATPLPWLLGWLVVLFGATALAHAFSVWEPYRDAVFCKAAANGLGVAFALFVLPPDWQWSPVIATLIVLCLWGVIVADEHRGEPYLKDRIRDSWRERKERRQKAEEQRRHAAETAPNAGGQIVEGGTEAPATSEPTKKDEQGDQPPSAPA